MKTRCGRGAVVAIMLLSLHVRERGGEALRSEWVRTRVGQGTVVASSLSSSHVRVGEYKAWARCHCNCHCIVIVASSMSTSDSRSSTKPQTRPQLDRTNHWLQLDFGPVAFSFWKIRNQQKTGCNQSKLQPVASKNIPPCRYHFLPYTINFPQF